MDETVLLHVLENFPSNYPPYERRYPTLCIFRINQEKRPNDTRGARCSAAFELNRSFSAYSSMQMQLIIC